MAWLYLGAALLMALLLPAAASPPGFSPGTAAIWAPARLGARHALLRPPTLRGLAAKPAGMTVLVGASPDVTHGGKTLALYKLYVNGFFVGIGPGRGDGSTDNPAANAVYDRIEVPAAVLASAAGTHNTVSVALQCASTAGGGHSAWAMLEANITGADGALLGRFATGPGGAWRAYNADAVYRPGVPDTASSYQRVNEDIDARAMANVSRWREPDFNLNVSGWLPAEIRVPAVAPVPKTTLPLQVESGVRPADVVQVSSGHYFFDFGREYSAGLELTVPPGTAAAWGGAGTRLQIRLAEQLSRFSDHEVLYPGWPFDPGNWNEIPQWQSIFTLADSGNRFEHHEYVGLFRYGEIRVLDNSTNNITKLEEDRLVMDFAEGARHPFDLSLWSVRYPFDDTYADSFVSSSDMLNRVWRLCSDTIKYTSLDTFTDSNVRERNVSTVFVYRYLLFLFQVLLHTRCIFTHPSYHQPYEADGFVTSQSFWALSTDRDWSRHSTEWVIHRPTWPTEWKQYAVLLAHAHWMQSGDASLADANFEQLANQTMLPFVDPRSQLVNFTASKVAPSGIPQLNDTCPLGGAICNSPMCHNNSGTEPGALAEGRSCDNIDWLPKFRAGYHFGPVSAIVNAFAVRSMAVLSELANATGRGATWGVRLAAQAASTRAAMVKGMWDRGRGLWCDGLCAEQPRGTFHSQHYLLWLGATPDDGVPEALAYLKNAGMVGSTYSANSLLHGLYNRGADVDYGQAPLNLMTSCDEHSWCHMLRLGATLTWEHWYPHDGTHAHPWASSPVSAIAQGLFGVRPVQPGWAVWRAKIAPGNLTHAAIAVATPRGPVRLNFTRRNGQTLGEAVTLVAGVPSGTTATLCVPLFWAQQFGLVLDSAPRPHPRLEGSGAYACVDDVGAGEHTLEARLRLPPKPSPPVPPAPPSPPDPLLPALPRVPNVDPDAISISGLSSGADFAAQFSVAFSKTIMGVGVFAGQPFDCATMRFPKDTLYPFGAAGTCNRVCEGCPANETVQCDHCKNHPQNIDVRMLADAARRKAAAGLIDDTKHIGRTKAFTYCGTNDRGHFGATVAARDFYAEFGSPLKFNFSVPSGHCWPQNGSSFAVPCGVAAKYINFWPLQNCDYDGPGEMLKHFYGAGLRAPAESLDATALKLFDQAPFDGNETSGGRGNVGLGDAGLVFVPPRCAAGARCALHVFLHGCQNPFFMEWPEARSLSVGRWAQTNDIVVLFPHMNGFACWDGYGTTGSDYNLRTGVQMTAIKQMIESVSGVQM